MLHFSKKFVVETLERASKTFLQAYMLAWTVKAGILDIGISVPSNASYDVLFTWDNVKAGVVGVALSLATSVGSKPIGADKDGPSIL